MPCEPTEQNSFVKTLQFYRIMHASRGSARQEPKQAVCMLDTAQIAEHWTRQHNGGQGSSQGIVNRDEVLLVSLVVFAQRFVAEDVCGC